MHIERGEHALLSIYSRFVSRYQLQLCFSKRLELVGAVPSELVVDFDSMAESL